MLGRRKLVLEAAESPPSAAPPHDESHHVSPKKQGRMSRQGFDRLNHQLDNQWEYTAKWQTNKPYKAMESRKDSRAAPWFPIKMMYQLVAQRS